MGQLVNAALPEQKPITITGNDAGVIMGADEAALVRLWSRKRGAPVSREDKGVKPTLDACFAQFKQRTGRNIAQGETRLRHPKLRWMGAILDGRLEDGAVLEAKFGRVNSSQEARAAFFALVQHDLWVAQAKMAVLCVVVEDGRCFDVEVAADPLYQHLLLTAERIFLRCLESGEAPSCFQLDPPEPKTIVDMSASREWFEAARHFRATARMHAEHERARARLALLLPQHAFRGAAAGVVLERAPFGGLRFGLARDGADA